MDRSHLRSLIALGGFFTLIAGLFLWNRSIERRMYLDPADAEAEIVHIEAGLPTDITLPPIRATDPSRGSTSTRSLLIVQYADYNCLACRLMEPELRQAMQAFPTQARLVWRDLPLNSDQADGILPPLAARCAQDQGKFWEMHDALFATAKLDRVGVSAAAQSAGIEMTAFETCVDTGKHTNALRAEIALAQSSGINESPTLFVGPHVIRGFIRAQELANLMGQLINNAPRR